MADTIRQALERLLAAEAHIHVAGPEYVKARDAALAAIAAPPTGGVTVGELEHILGRGLLATRGAARWLINHPRIGPLLRGEGAGPPKRVVLPEEPPDRDPPTWMDDRQAYAWCCGRSAAWADFVTEVVRQQQGGQADG